MWFGIEVFWFPDPNLNFLHPGTQIQWTGFCFTPGPKSTSPGPKSTVSGPKSMDLGDLGPGEGETYSRLRFLAFGFILCEDVTLSFARVSVKIIIDSMFQGTLFS